MMTLAVRICTVSIALLLAAASITMFGPAVSAVIFLIPLLWV